MNIKDLKNFSLTKDAKLAQSGRYQSGVQEVSGSTLTRGNIDANIANFVFVNTAISRTTLHCEFLDIHLHNHLGLFV